MLTGTCAEDSVSNVALLGGIMNGPESNDGLLEIIIKVPLRQPKSFSHQ
jgi:hypothetical protein